MQCPAMICRSLVGHSEWSLSSARPRYLLAEQAAQHPKLPAAAVDAIRLAAGVVVADINEHQLQHAHMRHDTLSATIHAFCDPAALNYITSNATLFKPCG